MDLQAARRYDRPMTKKVQSRTRTFKQRMANGQETAIQATQSSEDSATGDGVLSAMSQATEPAFAERCSLELSIRDSRVFVKALLKSEPVNDRLRETVRRYRSATSA